MKRILIIDDELVFLTPIVHHLKKADYDVTEIDNPIKAKVQLENISYDCIIVDYSMPYMSGIELVQWLREHTNKKMKETPVLLLTGWQEMTVVRAAYDAGINLFRTKTDLFNNPTEIIQAVEMTINLSPIHRIHNKLAVAFKRDVDNERNS